MQTANITYNLRKILQGGNDMIDGPAHESLIDVLIHAARLGIFDKWALDKLAHGLEVEDRNGVMWYIERVLEWR